MPHAPRWVGLLGALPLVLAAGGCGTLEERVAAGIEYILTAEEASPGDIIPFSFSLPKQVRASRVTFLNKAYRLYPRPDLAGRFHTAFLAVPAGAAPGDVRITCEFKADGVTGTIREDFPFQILPDLLPHPEEQVRARGFDFDRLQADYAKVSAALGAADFRNDRREAFLLPLSGRVTARYGTVRVYNRDLRRLLLGLEIEPMVSGSWEVNAAAEGRVVLAERLDMLGNTVVLDHGFSLATLYSQLASLEVKPGQVLHRGGRLGRVGDTGGAAIGKRLWYQLWVAEIPVNIEKYLDINIFK